MPTPRFTAPSRIPITRKTATATLATAGAAALAFSLVPSPADAEEPSNFVAADSVAWDIKAADVPGQSEALEVQWDSAVQLHTKQEQRAAEQQAGQEAGQQATKEATEAAEQQAAKEAEQRAAAERKPTEVRESESTSRSAEREQQTAATTAYSNTLDGWIREALDIMERESIPGSYEGLHRNIIRESSGDPSAINLWDINAINGTPSIGLLQVIQPTFDAYHVPGTPHDIYDPVSNLTAAANYAADRYGSIDHVDGPY